MVSSMKICWSLRERAAHHDRTCDHHAGSHLLADDKIGADAQNGGLEHDPKSPGERTKPAGDIAGLAVGFEIGAVGVLPPIRQHALQPHGANDLGIAARTFHQRVARHTARTDIPHRLLRQRVGKQRHRDQQHGADESGHADPEMEQEADAQIERHPWQVEKRRRSIAAQKAAHAVEIAQRLQPVAIDARQKRRFQDRIVDPAGKGAIEAFADPEQHAGAQGVENRLEGVETRRQHR